MGSHHPIRKIISSEPSPQIPDKLYFRIGDVARLCALPAYVLRFWESEFPQLKPHKGGTGQRLYRRKDVEMVLRIKSLLYDQGYTIAGARQVFKTEGIRPYATDTSQTESPAAFVAPAVLASDDMGEQIRQRAQQQDSLRELRSEVRALLDLLGGPVASTAIETDPRPMGSRLVLEPKPAARTVSRLRLERREEKAEAQSALFLFDELASADCAVPVETAE